MVSWYQSSEFGLGLDSKVTPTILATINLARQNTKYIRYEYTILVNGTDVKCDTNDNLTLHLLSCGS